MKTTLLDKGRFRLPACAGRMWGPHIRPAHTGVIFTPAFAAAHAGVNNRNVLRAACSGRTSEPHQPKGLFGIFLVIYQSGKGGEGMLCPA